MINPQLPHQHYAQSASYHGHYPGHPIQGQSGQYPGYHHGYHHMSHHPLKHETLRAIEPFVQYGLKEGQYTSHVHALREVAAIAYLVGKGYEPREAHRMVESWEINEYFYPWQP